MSPPQGNRRRNLLFGAKLLVSLFLLFVFFRIAGKQETLATLQRANPLWIGAGCLCIALVQLIKSVRFLALSRLLQQDVPFTRSLLAHCIVPILGMVTPGKLGEGMKIFLLGASKRRLGFLFLVERIMDLLALLFVAGFGFAFSRFFVITYLVLAGMLAGGVVVFLKLDLFVNKATQLLFKKSYLPENFFAEQSRRLLQWETLVPIGITVLVWFVTFGSSFCFCRSVGIELSYPRIALVFGWAVLIGLLSSLPGGVGPREMGIAFLFDGLYHIPRDQGAAAAAINLVTHYFVLGVLGAVAYLFYREYRKTFAAPATSPTEDEE